MSSSTKFCKKNFPKLKLKIAVPIHGLIRIQKGFQLFFFMKKNKKETAATMYRERKTQEERFTYIGEVNHVARHSFRHYSVQIPRHHTSNKISATAAKLCNWFFKLECKFIKA